MASLTQDAQGIKTLSDLLLGSSKSQTQSGGSSSRGLDISQAGIDALLKSILEGTSGIPGLASVAKGEKQSGMYNTTVNTQLINDLLTRSTGEVAKLSAKEVTNVGDKTITDKTNPALPTGLTAAAAGAMILKSALAKAGSKSGDAGATKVLGAAPKDTTGVAASIKNAITGETYDAKTADAIWSSSADRFDSQIADSIWSESANTFNSTAADAIWSESATIAPDLADSMSAPGGAMGDAGGWMGYFSAANDFFGSDGNKAQGAGEAIGTYILPGVGTVVGGQIGKALDPVFNSIDDNIIQPITGAIQDTWDSVFGGCYITTATCANSHKPDNCIELTLMRKFRDSYMYKTPERRQEVIDYYMTAPTMVTKINSLSAPIRDYIYDCMAKYFIQPCAIAVAAGDMKTAHKIYSALVKFAKEI